jgi:hypothetical protein
MNAAHFNAIAQRLQLSQVKDGDFFVPEIAIWEIAAALLDRIEALEADAKRAMGIASQGKTWDEGKRAWV